MARLPRFVLPGQPQHVIQRGNNRDIIFVAEEDYRFYLEKLQDACQKFGCVIHAYVLMTNHVHLLMTPDNENSISKVMQSLGRYYVQYFNHQYKRSGTLWEGRYKAALLDSDQYLLTCYRYIELNPVRAKMVEHPSDYPWSSYHCNGLGVKDGLITTHEMYRELGRSKEAREKAYRELFRHHIPEKTLTEIRSATNKAWVLGNERFQSRIEKLIERQTAPKSKGGDRKSGKYKIINRV